MIYFPLLSLAYPLRMSEHPIDLDFHRPDTLRLDSMGYDASKAHHASRAHRRRFSVDLSTEEHFESKDDLQCYGSYAHIREELDYSYHSHYRKERQWLHDSIIEDALNGGEEGQIVSARFPWLIFTVGAQGAGKRHTIEQVVKEQRFLLLSFVTVDADEIRHQLPEYASYVENSSELVDVLTQKEAGYIAETLTRAALEQGRHVIFDCSLKDAEWYSLFIDQLRSDYHMRVGMIHVSAQPEVILERAGQRALDTGRTVPEDEILSTLEYIPVSIDIVKPKVDRFFEIRNNDDGLQLLGAEWSEFTDAFSEICSLDKPTLTRLVTDEAEKKMHRRSLSRRRFSFMKSTEDNHKSDDMKFYGKFARIRKTLDYTYHCNYTFERQMLQDAIIDYFLSAAVLQDKNGEICTTPTEPWIVFTAGAMGAGKSYTMRMLVENGRFPLLAFVNVDPDKIRQKMPEFHLYISEIPEHAGELTRKEAGFIAEILTLAGLHAGKNVLVDGSLRDCEWYKLYFARLRNEFPSLRIAILHVTAPREAVFQRAAARGVITGRIVPRELLVRALEQVPKSVKILAPLVDYHAELHNAPNDIDITLVTPGETWEHFQSQWIQTCAWIPSRRMLRKIAKSSSSIDFLSESTSYASLRSLNRANGSPSTSPNLMSDS